MADRRENEDGACRRMRLLVVVLAPLLILELGPMFLRQVIARREYKVPRHPQSRRINEVIQEDEGGSVQQRCSYGQRRCSRCCKHPCYRTFACTPLHRLGVSMPGLIRGTGDITEP